MARKRRIFFLTGARSDYDLMTPVIRMCRRQRALAAEVLAAGAHLSPHHGMGIQLIRKGPAPIAGTVESLLSSESWQGRALSFAHLLEGLIQLLARDKPEILFVAGDREEALAGALAANFLEIVVAHLHGGDRCAATELDEVLRPAISKLAHLHFTATEGHRQRLIRMGEPAERIWTTGAPSLDSLRQEPDIADAQLQRAFGVDVRKPFFLLIQHPSPLVNVKTTGEEMEQVLQGVLSLGHPVFCSYPNFDPGNVAIRQAIDQARAKTNKLIVFHSLPRRQFVALYRRCSAIVGNSSSIVMESPFLRVPGILAGPRQNLRERGPNVLQVGLSAREVKMGCKRALEDKSFLRQVQAAPSLYGDGKSGARIARILGSVRLLPALRHKMMSY